MRVNSHKLNRFFNLLHNILFFWRSKKSIIPQKYYSARRSIHHAEKNAGIKTVLFAKKHFLSSEEMQILYQTELKYENEKYKIKHGGEDSTLGTVKEAKGRKYDTLKEQLSDKLYQTYRTHRRHQNQSKG